MPAGGRVALLFGTDRFGESLAFFALVRRTADREPFEDTAADGLEAALRTLAGCGCLSSPLAGALKATDWPRVDWSSSNEASSESVASGGATAGSSIAIIVTSSPETGAGLKTVALGVSDMGPISKAGIKCLLPSIIANFSSMRGSAPFC